MKLGIAQLIVGQDMAANQIRIQAACESIQPGDWVVFPEGVLSGYFPDDDAFMKNEKRSVAAF